MVRCLRAIIDVLESSGVSVEVTEYDHRVVVTAQTPNGHTHICHGPDLYDVLCAVAHEVGLDLEDDAPDTPDWPLTGWSPPSDN